MTLYSCTYYSVLNCADIGQMAVGENELLT